MDMASPALLFHTIRHLRPSQVVSRAHLRLAERLHNPAASRRRMQRVKIGDCHWNPRTDFLPSEQQGNCAAAILEGRLQFQNDDRSVGRPFDWGSVGAPLLWRYNLHYFDYVWSLDFGAAREIALDWIRRHAIGRGQVGWEPYPTSLRLMNWCGFFFGRHFRQVREDPQFLQLIQDSIGAQTAWLSRRLEYHLLGNHLLENAAALVLVGSCFSGSEAERFGRIGMRILKAELEEQVLADGMHFELSPMYHSRVLHLLLVLMNVATDEVRDWLGDYAARMLDALALTSHPDGRIALLNDSAFGVYPGLSVLAEYACRLGVNGQQDKLCGNKTFALKNAGYFGAKTKQGHYVICDAGKIGPDYIPGHAHGDIFSFELSMFGDRLVVDSGVHDYLRGDMRRYCRSTAAHNTVEIDGQDQCEFWDTFKVARRGRPYDVRFREHDGGFSLSGRHDGYHRLQGRPTHHREFQWRHDGSLVVRDRVESSVPVPVVSRIHLHPKCRISGHRESSLILERSGRWYAIQADGGELQVGESWYCPEFGVREKNLIVELTSWGKCVSTAFHLAPCQKIRH